VCLEIPWRIRALFVAVIAWGDAPVPAWAKEADMKPAMMAVRGVGLAILGCLALVPRGALGQTFSNTAPITIPDVGMGNPYPSTITVSGMNRPIEAVTVRLLGLTHSFSEDVSILLVAPGGRTVLLMSGVGGSCLLSGLNMTFAAGAPRITGCPTSGVFSPTTVGTGPVFPSPAAPGPHGSLLESLVGIEGNGNGEWRLFVIDTETNDQGTISGGWSLTFEQPSPVTYQGELRQDGSPLDGAADLRFTFFDIPTGGTPLGSVTIGSVPVSQGVFTVDLPFPSSTLSSRNRWLEIAVRSPGGTEPFTTLSARQAIRPAPSALQAGRALFAEAADRAETASSAATAQRAFGLASADGTAPNAMRAGEGGVIGIGRPPRSDSRLIIGEPNSTNWLIMLDNVAAPTYAGMYVTSAGKLRMTSDAEASSPVYAELQFNGTWSSTSDARAKTDIQPEGDLLERALKLRPVSYAFKGQQGKEERSLGFLAQDVLPLFPSLVSGSPESEELMTLNYSGLAVVAIGAVQELRAENVRGLAERDAVIAELRAEVAAMRERLEKVERASRSKGSGE
jgi:subtilisin-like proprotein convertase family protein